MVSINPVTYIIEFYREIQIEIFLKDEICIIIFQYLKVRKAIPIGNYVSGPPPTRIFENMTI